MEFLKLKAGVKHAAADNPIDEEGRVEAST
jgi:hypothetical protein